MSNEPNLCATGVGGHGPPYRMASGPGMSNEANSPGVRRSREIRSTKLEILNKSEMQMLETNHNAPNEANLPPGRRHHGGAENTEIDINAFEKRR